MVPNSEGANATAPPSPGAARAWLLDPRSAVRLCAALAAAALLLPWGNGRLLTALSAPRSLGPVLSPVLVWMTALGALLVALVTTWAALRHERAGLRGIAAAATGAASLWALFGVPQAGVTTFLDPLNRSIVGIPAPLVMAALGASLTALPMAPRSLTLRLIGVGCIALLLWMLLAPVSAARELLIPMLVLTDSARAGALQSLFGVTLLLVLLLSPLGLRTAPASGAARTLGAVALALPSLWLLATGAPVAAAALSGASALLLAVGVRRMLLEPYASHLPFLRTQAPVLGEISAIVTTFCLFALLKTHGLRVSASDENIYFYDAVLVARGAMPYRDFFFAHPPVHVLVPAVLFRLFGFHLLLAKSLAPMFAAISGVFVWRLCRVRMGRLAGMLALPAFLFASEILKASTNLTGVNLTLLFIAAGTYYALMERPFRAGALFALAASTGFYAIAGAMVLIVTTAARGPRTFARFAGAFVLVFGAINLFFYGVAGSEYIDGVYRYHLLKAAKDPRQLPLLGGDVGPIRALLHNFWVFLTGARFAESLYNHGALFWTALLSPLAMLIRAIRAPADPRPLRTRLLSLVDPRRLWDPTPDAAARLLFLIAFAYFLQLSMFRELFDFYFVLPFAALAALAAYTLWTAAGLLSEGARRLRDGLPAAVPISLAALVLLATLLSAPLRRAANERAWPSERTQAGRTLRFRYVAPPVLPGLSGLAHLLFWRDSRVRGELQPGYAHYLWSKKRWFSTAEQMARHIRETTPKDATILGASTVAPLLALLSGRAIAASQVDTNSKRFKTHLATVEELFDSACATKLAYVIGAEDSLFASRHLSRLLVISRYFSPEHTYYDPELRHFGSRRFVLLKRKGDLDAEPPVCRYNAR